MRFLPMAAPAMLWAVTAAAAGAPVTMTAAADGGVDLHDHDGKLLVAHVALKTPALRRGQPRLREVVVDGHRVAELRVPIRGTPAEEVWIGDVGGSGQAPAAAAAATGGK